MPGSGPAVAWRARLGGWMRRSRIIYTPLSFGFLAYLFLSHPDRVLGGLAGLTAGRVALILVLIGAGHFFIAVSTFCLFRALGHDPSLGLVVFTHLDRLPARYLPGGIWQTVTRALDFSAHGLPSALILRVVGLEMAISPALAAFMGGPSLTLGQSGSLAAVGWLACVLGLCGLVLAPWVAVRVGGGAGAVQARGYYGLAVLSFGLVWLLYGTAFVLFAGQLLPGLGWFHTIGVYWISWLLGFLAFFAPQGIGVFEVAATYLLSGELGGGLVAALLGFRALGIAGDLGTWALSRPWRRVT